LPVSQAQRAIHNRFGGFKALRFGEHGHGFAAQSYNPLRSRRPKRAISVLRNGPDSEGRQTIGLCDPADHRLSLDRIQEASRVIDPLINAANAWTAKVEFTRRAEAEVFADIALGMGVPRDALLLESRSTNTGENVELSRRLLAERGLRPHLAIAVQKPYMERRTLATFGVRWPELELVVTSPQLSFDDYTSQGISRDDVIHIMVGDLQRLSVYAKKGFSTPQEIPPDVAAAYEGLVAGGYTKRLLKGE
jgi:uncharacterized SAM-binding protein YcdF (DUF218 family)